MDHARLAIGGVAIAGVAGLRKKIRNVAASKSDALAPAANALELKVGTGYAQALATLPRTDRR